MIRRRDLLFVPGLFVPGVMALPELNASAAGVHRIRLDGQEPLAQLAGLWKYGPVDRIVVRPEAAWWPSPSALPDRWQAWIDLPAGGAVHVIACGTSTSWPGHPVAAEVLKLLTLRLPAA